MDRRDQRNDSVNYRALSPREREVMVLAARGITNKQIARELRVTEGTVKIHLHRVYQKLGIKSRFALAVLARNLPSESSGRRGDPDAA
jgi:DNA-binding NarL/FixJ family response regulator